MRQYLKANVVLEPLVDRWYAWTHLISPATAARNLTHRHLRIMESYIASPDVHQAAVKDPRLTGGPFMDYPDESVELVEQLRLDTLRKRGPMVAFSQAIDCLNEKLNAHSAGTPLEALYHLVPSELRGYVELVYDLNHHPGFRLIEPLLYRSPYYFDDAQSIMLSTISGDDRQFVLSTPRICDDGNLHLEVPFSHPAIDRLARMTKAADETDEIADLLELTTEQRKLFASLFQSEQAALYEAYEQAGLRWRYFGHACILLEAKGISILFDPVLSYTYESQISRYTYQDLPDHIDFVVITHNHQDHILFETLLQIRHRIGTILIPRGGGGALQDPSLKLALEYCGFERIRELGEMEKMEFEGGFFVGIPFFGEHGDLNIQTKLAYLVELHGKRLMFAADSNNLSPCTYELVREWVGPVDVLFLGMECDGAPMSWLYGPLFSQKVPRQFDQARRLAGSNCRKGMAMVDALGCREVYVYAMGQEPWLNYIMSLKYTKESNPIVQSDQLLAECHQRGIVAERLFGEKELVIA